MHRAKLTVRGERNFTAGAGVVKGALTSIGEGSASFTLSRNWGSSVRFGISRNEKLNSSEVFNTQFAEVSVDRRLAWNISMYASYSLERQTTGDTCTGPICQYGGTRNAFGFGLAWTGKPLSIF
jgi:hypothetical protein